MQQELSCHAYLPPLSQLLKLDRSASESLKSLGLHLFSGYLYQRQKQHLYQFWIDSEQYRVLHDRLSSSPAHFDIYTRLHKEAAAMVVIEEISEDLKARIQSFAQQETKDMRCILDAQEEVYALLQDEYMSFAFNDGLLWTMDCLSSYCKKQARKKVTLDSIFIKKCLQGKMNF